MLYLRLASDGLTNCSLKVSRVLSQNHFGWQNNRSLGKECYDLSTNYDASRKLLWPLKFLLFPWGKNVESLVYSLKNQFSTFEIFVATHHHDNPLFNATARPIYAYIYRKVGILCERSYVELCWKSDFVFVYWKLPVFNIYCSHFIH